MLSLRYWNLELDNKKMMRLSLKQANKLNVGDQCFYINTADEIPGVVYIAKIKAIYKYHMELECFPLLMTVEDSLWSQDIKSHTESIAYTDFCIDSNQALYKTLVLNDGEVIKIQDYKEEVIL